MLKSLLLLLSLFVCSQAIAGQHVVGNLDVTGNVGVGSTVPQKNLDVQGQIMATSTTWDGQVFGGVIAAYQAFAVGAAELPHAGYFEIFNTGSTVGTTGHGLGVLGRCKDTVSGAMNCIGAEGRTDGSSGVSGVQYQGINGDAIWVDPDSGNGTTFQGSVMGGVYQSYIFNHDGVTPRNQGFSYGIYVGPGSGALVGYGAFIAAQGGGSGASFGVGLAVGASNYKTIQVSSDVDSTTAAGGISFGVSNDTDIYRSAVNTLKTDGSFLVINNIGIGSTTPGQKLDVQGTVRIFGNLGIGTSPSTILSVSGQAQQTIGEERNSTSNTAGNGLLIKAGGATSGATNKNGGNLDLYAGTATGTGTGDINFYVSGQGTTGTSDITPFKRLSLTGNFRAGVTLFDFWNSDGSSAMYLAGGPGNTVLALDGTYVDQVIFGVAYYGSGSLGTYLGSNAHPVAVGVSPDASIAHFYVQTPSTTEKDFVIRAIAAQTANLTEWQNSSGTPLNVVKVDGNIGIGSISPGYQLDVQGTIRASSDIKVGAQSVCQANGTNCLSQGTNAVSFVSYQPGLLSAVNATIGVNYKFSKASTVDNIIGSAVTFSCIGNPTVTMYECGTSTTCATPTTIGTVTVTAAGTLVSGTVSSSAITAGDYIGWAITAGTCASIDIAATAQVHSN